MEPEYVLGLVGSRFVGLEEKKSAESKSMDALKNIHALLEKENQGTRLSAEAIARAETDQGLVA